MATLLKVSWNAILKDFVLLLLSNVVLMLLPHIQTRTMCGANVWSDAIEQ